MWMQDAVPHYRTALIGKYLNGAPALSPRPTGWTTWRQLLSDQSQYGFQVNDGTTPVSPSVSQMDYLEAEAEAFPSMEVSTVEFPWTPEWRATRVQRSRFI